MIAVLRIALVAILLSLPGGLATQVAFAAEPLSSGMESDAYHAHRHPAPSTCTLTERDPPAVEATLTPRSGVCARSHGLLACPQPGVIRSYDDYDHSAQIEPGERDSVASESASGSGAGGLPVARAVRCAAKTGGAGPVRVGRAGENADRSVYNIGPKASAEVGGRTRIFDGLTDTTVSEVKNVARQSLTLQLRDSMSYAQSTGRTFDLYVRPDTYMTGPLRDAIGRGDITLRFIP